MVPSLTPGRENEATRHFEPGRKHSILIHIGPAAPDERLLRLDRAFPDEALPDKEITLDLYFVPLAAPFEPAQKKFLHLPRRGRSEPVEFHFDIPAEVPAYEARIIVSHGNRVLQTARLRGDIQAVHLWGGIRSIQLLPETMARKNFEPLEDSTNFHASYIFNWTSSGQPLLTRVGNNGVKVSDVGGIEELVESFDAIYDNFANSIEDDWKPSGDFTEHDIDLLRTAAINGEQLFSALLERRDGAKLQRQKAIQVVTKSNKRIPLEFVYETSQSPNLDAAICPDWQSCLKSAECQHLETAEMFCPSKFWGLSRVIERHHYNPELEEVLKEEWLIVPEPSSARRSLHVLNHLLLGGSAVVDQVMPLPTGMPRVVAAAEKFAGKTAVAISWKDWRSRVEAKPDSLLLIVHTESLVEKNLTVRLMEISGDMSLHSGQINSSFTGGDENHRPLVVLLGCHTGSGRMAFAEIAARVRRSQAAVVIGSGSYLNARHVVPFTELLLKLMRETLDASPPISFGEFMRRLRQRCLLEGHLLVLALTAYGDADWILEPSP